MTRSFVSYAQNQEDVVLWRALKGVVNGHYIDVGANDPVHDSVTHALYSRGWRGVNIEPVSELAKLLREQRPGDWTIEAVVSDTGQSTQVLHEVVGTGLSSVLHHVAAGHGAEYDTRDVTVDAVSLEEVFERSGWGPGGVHFLKVDVEGAEASVLRSVDLARWRPWVLVIEATAPLSQEPTHAEWEPLVLGAGYRFCLFDGLSRFYLHTDHADLAPLLSYPAYILDDYVHYQDLERQQDLRRKTQEAEELKARVHRLEGELDGLQHDLVRWRGAVLDRWTQAATGSGEGGDAGLRQYAQALERELAATRATVSWRITAPLRMARRATRGGGGS